MIRALLLLTLMLPFFAEEHKLVYLLSGPRSLSTICMRMMESRGDFTIYHEPTMGAFHQIHFREFGKAYDRADAFKSFDEVKHSLAHSLKKGHVFAKDMSFSSYPLLSKDLSFLQNPQHWFVFLIRDPHHMAISFYRKAKGVIEGSFDLIGFDHLYEIYQLCKQHNPNGVKLLFTHDLYTDPRAFMDSLCSHVGIPVRDSAFTWKDLGEHFTGEHLWHEQKRSEVTHYWHGAAIRSTCIKAPSTYEVDANGKPTFSEIENEEHRKVVRSIYRKNLEYYKKFLEEAI